MDMHGMPWIKMQSSIPGNFHRQEEHTTTTTTTRKTTNAHSEQTSRSAEPATSPPAEPHLTTSSTIESAAPTDAASSSHAARRRSRSTRTAASPSFGSSLAPPLPSTANSHDGMSGLEALPGPDSSGSDSGAHGSSDSDEDANDDPLNAASPTQNGEFNRRHTTSACSALNAGRESQRHAHSNGNGKKRRKHGDARAATSSKAQRHSGGGGGSAAQMRDASFNGEPMDLEHGAPADDLASPGIFSALPPLQLRPFIVPPSAAPLTLALISQLAAAPETSSPAALVAAYGPRPTVGDACLLSFQARFSSGAIWAKNRAIWFHGPASSSSAQQAAAFSMHGAGDAARRMYFNASTVEWIHESVEMEPPAQTTAAVAPASATQSLPTTTTASPPFVSQTSHAPPAPLSLHHPLPQLSSSSSSSAAAAVPPLASAVPSVPAPGFVSHPPIVCRNPLRFVLGSGELLAPLEAAVTTMFRGESCTIATRDHNRTLCVYELQLVDFGTHL